MLESTSNERTPSVLDQLQSDLPAGLAAPARRALIRAGCWRLEHVAQLSEAQVKQMHGIGPNALQQLQQALETRGLRFRAS